MYTKIYDVSGVLENLIYVVRFLTPKYPLVVQVSYVK